MVPRRSSSICLPCRLRSPTSGRIRANTFVTRSLDTLPLKPEDTCLYLGSSAEPTRGPDSLRLIAQNTNPPCRPRDLAEEARNAALSFEALFKQRDLRVETLRNLSNPWPDAALTQGDRGKKGTSSTKDIFRSAPMPHPLFRELLKQRRGVPKEVRQLLRGQLLHCDRPRDVLRVVAAAFQHVKVAESLSVQTESLMRAIYRCRIHFSDPEILVTLTAIIARFRFAGVAIEAPLLFMALKFAARSRSSPAMRKLLNVVRREGIPVTSHVFRSVIAKCSIGHRGLGEIRNGRWRRHDLLQVLKGFDEEQNLPKAEQCHLGSFLIREEWQYLHGWIAVLARCKDSDSIWKEWELWKVSAARKKPRGLLLRGHIRSRLTTRMRGDFWFVEQMTYSGNAKRAWQMLQETEIDFCTLKNSVKDRLLENVEHATVWNDRIRAEMIQKCHRDLTKIEQALGVRWIPSSVEGDGHHELVEDQEEVLERLGAEGWRLDPDYGYPHEDSPIVPQTERVLHDAEEGS